MRKKRPSLVEAIFSTKDMHKRMYGPNPPKDYTEDTFRRTMVKPKKGRKNQ